MASSSEVEKDVTAMCPSAMPAAWKEESLATSSDRFERRLVEEMTGLRLELISQVHDGLSGVRQELAASRVEFLKWSFLFWAGQLAAIAGLLSFMMKR
jgi:hypothetical protein